MSVANIKFRSFDLELYVMITNQSITAHANHPVVIPKSKMIFKVSITTLIRKWELAKYYATLMNPLPAYVAMGGRDCDDYSWSRLDKFPNHYQAVKEIESAQEWADGPMGGHLVSKKEYLKLKREKEEEEATYSRDDEEEVERQPNSINFILKKETTLIERLTTIGGYYASKFRQSKDAEKQN